MEKKYLSDGLLNNASSIGINNTESQCFHTETDFIKIFRPNVLTKARISTIEKVSEYDNPLCVCPKYEILESKTKETISGFGTDYLKDYSILSSIIDSESLSLQDRKELAKKICILIESLLNDNVVYYDVHADNIMTKNGDIRLLDMDGTFIKGIVDDYVFRRGFYTSYANMNSLVLSILFGIDIPYFPELTISNPKLFMGRANNSERTLIDYSINHAYEVFSPLDCIDNVREDYIETIKKQLKKQA